MMLKNLNLTRAVEGLKNKDFKATELLESVIDRIEERNNRINAFITVVDFDNLKKKASEADKKIATGDYPILSGIPFGVKDAICTKGIRSTGAAKILDNYKAPYSATVVKKIEDNGAIMVGKQNCDSFGHGASNEQSMYGLVRNPIDESRVAGGSSGGSAAAVADNQCIFSVAEDTGGSIRQPASFCGVVGLRPSYGRNSRYGIMPMASSLDTVGPIAKSVEDIAVLMEIMAGRDEKDATTVNEPVPNYSKEINKSIKNLKIGIPKEYMELDGLDSEVEKIMNSKIKELEELGVQIQSVSLPHTKYAIPTYYILVPSEDSSNLGRLDGIRYGVRVDGNELYDIYAGSRAAGFPAEVKRRIIIGTYSLSAGYYDAYYRKAQKVRTLISRDFEEVFKKVDVLLTSTSPFPAFKIGEKVDDILQMYTADAFVAPAALAGLPALSVPGGLTKDNLPVGLQIIGPRMGEAQVLNVGNKICFNNADIQIIRIYG
ncbi:MAG: Asp-tRNA(Asn)/Glu-tRNA(Gln) amidotransferase subunit GatA [Candidatus Magasanikbacteria bacterium]|nr:Asp-tRNA(Asn)/Glu-tRNA(Gln) amidotransferase subunit GatA [Candidatus Magasanikbacteria bacterium]